MPEKIYVSGMHSGQSPCPGVGIVRSLRKAFPNLEIIGVDHWQGSSGLHDASVDDVLLLPPWHQINNPRHSENINSLLQAGHLWFSGVDMEVHWLSENLDPHPNLLAPNPKALELTAKPGVQAFARMGFRIPEFLSAYQADSEVHAFLRYSSWQCWLKTPFHEAQRINSWEAFEQARENISQRWHTSRLFLQRHVVGNEESIAFSAYQGKLLAAVYLQKRQLTGEGKTWAGRVTALEPQLYLRLQEIIEELHWSGGGELEFTRDPDGNNWIIECNPRFPAWIFGAALTGFNLPAQIVAQAWNLSLAQVPARYPFFTRVVQEIAAKEAIGIPVAAHPNAEAWRSEAGKSKGSATLASLPTLKEAQGEDDEEFFPQPNAERLSPLYLNEMQSIAQNFTGETPARVHMENWTLRRFHQLAEGVRAANTCLPEIRIGFSMKTSSTDAHLRKAQECGFYFECISQKEVQRALAFGVPFNKIILNGPGKFWPLTNAPVTGLHMLFCDSNEEFDRVIKTPNIAEFIGFRFKLPKLSSRFGVSLEDFENFKRLIEAVKQIKGKSDLCFHFHMPSWAIGVQRWSEAFQSFLIWCQSVEQLSGVAVRQLDLGGGFFPGDLGDLGDLGDQAQLDKLDNLDLDDLKTFNFQVIQEAVRAALPKVRAIYFEPGRSLTQDGEVLVSRVLDVRRSHDHKLLEIVVDASIAELPLIQTYSHKIFYHAQSPQTLEEFQASQIPQSPQVPQLLPASCQALRKGRTRVLGRICMESDILSRGLDFPDSVKLGDLVIFGDAGAYERTMCYDFGRG